MICIYTHASKGEECIIGAMKSSPGVQIPLDVSVIAIPRQQIPVKKPFGTGYKYGNPTNRSIDKPINLTLLETNIAPKK